MSALPCKYFFLLQNYDSKIVVCFVILYSYQPLSRLFQLYRDETISRPYQNGCTTGKNHPQAELGLSNTFPVWDWNPTPATAVRIKKLRTENVSINHML